MFFSGRNFSRIQHQKVHPLHNCKGYTNVTKKQSNYKDEARNRRGEGGKKKLSNRINANVTMNKRRVEGGKHAYCSWPVHQPLGHGELQSRRL